MPALTATLQVPGVRTVEIGRAGPGQIVGEIALLDGRGHTMRVEAAEPTSVLALGRLDFEAMLRGRQPAASALKRRLAALFTARLRVQLRHLAGSLGGDPAAEQAPALSDLERCRPPDSRYMRRMATFHDFDQLVALGTAQTMPDGLPMDLMDGAADGAFEADGHGRLSLWRSLATGFLKRPRTAVRRRPGRPPSPRGPRHGA